MCVCVGRGGTCVRTLQAGAHVFVILTYNMHKDGQTDKLIPTTITSFCNFIMAWGEGGAEEGGIKR